MRIEGPSSRTRERKEGCVFKGRRLEGMYSLVLCDLILRIRWLFRFFAMCDTGGGEVVVC